MIKIYLKGRNDSYSASGLYNEKDNTVTVLKGSKINEKIDPFNGATAIENHRKGKIKNCTVIEDVCFKSPSTAANFITGRSTNGLIAWKDENGTILKVVKSSL